MGGAFEALQELSANERDNLGLATRIEGFQLWRIRRAFPVGKRIIDAQREQWLSTAECLLHGFQQASIGNFELVGCHARGFARGENDETSRTSTLAFLHIDAGTLNDEFFEDKVFLKRVFRAEKFAGLVLY